MKGLPCAHWYVVLRRQPLTRGARLRLGSPDPLCLGRMDGIANWGGTDVQELEIQIDENVEPNDLWVGRDCQDYVSTSLFSDSWRFCYTQKDDTYWLMSNSLNMELFFLVLNQHWFKLFSPAFSMTPCTDF